MPPPFWHFLSNATPLAIGAHAIPLTNRKLELRTAPLITIPERAELYCIDRLFEPDTVTAMELWQVLLKLHMEEAEPGEFDSDRLAQVRASFDEAWAHIEAMIGGETVQRPVRPMPEASSESQSAADAWREEQGVVVGLWVEEALRLMGKAHDLMEGTAAGATVNQELMGLLPKPYLQLILRVISRSYLGSRIAVGVALQEETRADGVSVAKDAPHLVLEALAELVTILALDASDRHDRSDRDGFAKRLIQLEMPFGILSGFMAGAVKSGPSAPVFRALADRTDIVEEAVRALDTASTVLGWTRPVPSPWQDYSLGDPRRISLIQASGIASHFRAMAEEVQREH